MKQLHNKVNIVPVIAKADVLTKKEMQKLKKKILDEIADNGIRIYSLPECDSDEDEEYKEQVRTHTSYSDIAFSFGVCPNSNLNLEWGIYILDEHKMLFHIMFVIGSSIKASCTFRCMWCQYFTRSKRAKSARQTLSMGGGRS